MKKVLVIDRDPAILDVVEMVLVPLGLKVIKRDTLEEVPEAVEALLPNIIILGVPLPGAPNANICAEFKEKYNLPVILFSTLKKDTAPLECLDFSYIEKPFNIAVLAQTVMSHLQISTTN